MSAQRRYSLPAAGSSSPSFGRRRSAPRVGLLVGQVSNLTVFARSGWKPDLPATHPLWMDRLVGWAESSRPTMPRRWASKTRPTLQDPTVKNVRPSRLLLPRGRLRQLQVLPVGRPAEQLVLDDVDGLGHLVLVRRVQLRQGEELARGLGGHLPAIGLGLGESGGDHAVPIGLGRLGYLVRGRGRRRAHRGHHAHRRGQLQGVPSRRIVHWLNSEWLAILPCNNL